MRLVTENTDNCPLTIRVTSTDGAAALGLAEDVIKDENPGWDLVRILCCIHVLARIFGRTLALAKGIKDGMMKLVLSVGKIDLMGRLRRGAREALRAKVVLVSAVHLTPEARAYKEAVLDAFIGTHEVRVVTITTG